MASIPEAVVQEFIAKARDRYGGASVADRVAYTLLDRLAAAIADHRDPVETSLSRESLESELGRSAKIEHTQLSRLATAAGTWMSFTVGAQQWWGRLLGPNAPARGDGDSYRYYFLPEVFPAAAVMRFRQTEVDEVPGLESLNVLVGDPDDLAVNWLFPLLPTAQRIDLVNAYRVNEWVRTRLETFRCRESERPEDRPRLRACFMDVRDAELMKIFERKVGEERIANIQERVRESVEKTLLAKTVRFQSNRLHVELRGEPPKAQFSFYLTPQRLTYLYWRVDDRAIIVPLDIKQPQDPKPKGWAISEQSSRSVFDYYATDVESLFAEVNLVYSTP